MRRLRKDDRALKTLTKDTMFVAAWNSGGYCRTSRSFISHDPYFEADEDDEKEQSEDEDEGREV